MNRTIQDAKVHYNATVIPVELALRVQETVKKSRRRQLRRGLFGGFASFAAACCTFVLLVNFCTPFAEAVSDIPVINVLARVFTAEKFRIEDSDRILDISRPEIGGTGDTKLEQRINTEIKQQIDALVSEAELRAEENYNAWKATGGTGYYVPLTIEIDYLVKSQSADMLSFILYVTETRANSYTQIFCYNINLRTGAAITLADLLGPDWKALCDEAVRSGIDARTEAGGVFFTAEDGAVFNGIDEQQSFYIDDTGCPVLIFEKYTIAPGYMGIQEFPVAPPAPHSVL